MELVPLALSPNALATAGSIALDEGARITGGADAALDFAALLAAGMTSEAAAPAFPSPNEAGVESGLVAEKEGDPSAQTSDALAILADVPAPTLPPLPAMEPRQNVALRVSSDGTTAPQSAGKAATPVAGLAADAAIPAASAQDRHPAESASERADLAIHFGAKETPGNPVLPTAPWRSENALHGDTGIQALSGSARETESLASVPHAVPAHAMPDLPVHAMAVSSAEARAPAVPTAVREVAAPVRSSEFADAFSQQIVWMADKDAQVAELKLNPPELGPVEVRLTISGDEASAQFVSAHAEVRAAIESSLVRLRESLAGAGIELGEAFVSAESFRDDSSASNDGRGQKASSYGESARENGPSHGRSQSAVRRGLVDIYA